jgi:hypothetical protein
MDFQSVYIYDSTKNIKLVCLSSSKLDFAVWKNTKNRRFSPALADNKGRFKIFREFKKEDF